jgi:organic radical activating enzyme
MTFAKTFCPSPWFHMRINNSGHYEYCRWAVKDNRNAQSSIQQQSPKEFFQSGMAPVRQSLLDGKSLPGCHECYQMEQHGKVSGRQRQLLKIGVTEDQFVHTMQSSPWYPEFQSTAITQGHTGQCVQDWQIDLGNYCNSACIFCDPASSSKLASEFKKIGIIKEIPSASWTDNPDLVDYFVEHLQETPAIAYLHFIGGETLITPAFRKILNSLVDCGLCEKISIGFTTNLTVWDQEIVDLLCKFKQVNLGMSVECLTPLNDYIRHGSKLARVQTLLSQWITVAQQQDWLMQLRITPTLFSIWHLDTVYEYAYQKNIAVESCNFLNDPAFMRPSVLPREFRSKIIDKLTNWVNQHAVESTATTIINTRDPNIAKQQIIEDAGSYINYLTDQPDESYRLRDLVAYIKLLESSRQNSILEHLPEYEPFLRSAGY